ncbi:hypothetical protein [Janibacter melonis]|uniref:hypothetical protein n=1 Tax=Janibacter melonis TaxID=262209 RepID=UPI00174E1D7C|nr:hypothetical protein [Janibacter melonis]
MSRPPATLTSPDHALGIAMVCACAVLAVVTLMGVGTTTALTELVGHDIAATLIPMMIFTAACGSLFSIYAVVRARNATAEMQHGALIVELGCKVVLTITMATYAFALTKYYWGATNPAINIQILIWFLTAGLGGRVWQIARDLRTVRRASAAGVPADPSPLGEPDPTGR